jgi:Flp pilus assembly protein TadD
MPTTVGIGSPSPNGEPQVKVGPEQQYNVHLELGRMYEAQNCFDAAIAEYQKALDASGKLPQHARGPKPVESRAGLAHRRMGGAYDRLGRFAMAETHYRAALKLSPNSPKVWNDAGYSYYLQRRWDDAERCLKTAAKIDPNNPKIQTNLGLTLAAKGKTDESLAALTKAGGKAVGHANLAYLLAALGKTDEARMHYIASLQIQPDLAPARQALAALDGQVPRTGLVAAAPAPVSREVTRVSMTSEVATTKLPPLPSPAAPTVIVPRSAVPPVPPPPGFATDASVNRVSAPLPSTIPLPSAPRWASTPRTQTTQLATSASAPDAPTTIPWPNTMNRSMGVKSP